MRRLFMHNRACRRTLSVVAMVLFVALVACDEPSANPEEDPEPGALRDACQEGVDECASDADCSSPFEACDLTTCQCAPALAQVRTCLADSDNCQSNDDCYVGTCRGDCNCDCHACEDCQCLGLSHGDTCTSESGVLGTCQGCRCVIPACESQPGAECTSDADCWYGDCDPETCTCACESVPASSPFTGTPCDDRQQGQTCSWHAEPDLPVFSGTCNEHCQCCECYSDADCPAFEYCDSEFCLCEPRPSCSQCDDCDDSACATCGSDQGCIQTGDGACVCASAMDIYGCWEEDTQCYREPPLLGLWPGDECTMTGGYVGTCDATCDCVVDVCPHGLCIGQVDGDACSPVNSGTVPGVCVDCICVCPEGSACAGLWEGNTCEVAPGVYGQCQDCACVRQCPANSQGCQTDADCTIPGTHCDENCNCVATAHACWVGSDGCTSDADCNVPPCDLNTCNCACPNDSDGCTSFRDCPDWNMCNTYTCDCEPCPEGSTGCGAGCPADTYCNGCYCVPEYHPQAASLSTCPEGSECHSQYFDVYDCTRTADGYQWFEVEVFYVDGEPVSETVVGGPHTSTEWRPFCPGDSDDDGGGDGQDCGGAAAC